MNAETVTIQASLKIPSADELVGPEGRIAMALHWRRSNPNALADRLSSLMGRRVYPSTTGAWIAEEKEGKAPSPPTAQYLVWLPEALDVDGHWLLTGQGDADRTPYKEIEQRYRAILAIVTKDDAGAADEVLTLLGSRPDDVIDEGA